MPRAPVTQATITRTIRAVQAAGVLVQRVEVSPDGTIIVIPTICAQAAMVKAADNDLTPLQRRRARRGEG